MNLSPLIQARSFGLAHIILLSHSFDGLMSAAGNPLDETDLLKSDTFWRIAASAVFLQHLLLLQPEGPFEIDFEDHCFWLAQLLRFAHTEIVAELDTHQVLLLSPKQDGEPATWLLFRKDLATFCSLLLYILTRLLLLLHQNPYESCSKTPSATASGNARFQKTWLRVC